MPQSAFAASTPLQRVPLRVQTCDNPGPRIHSSITSITQRGSDADRKLSIPFVVHPAYGGRIEVTIKRFVLPNIADRPDHEAFLQRRAWDVMWLKYPTA